MPTHVVYDTLSSNKWLRMKEFIINNDPVFEFYNNDGTLNHKFIKAGIDKDGLNITEYKDKENKSIFVQKTGIMKEYFYNNSGNLFHFKDFSEGILKETHYKDNIKIYYREEVLNTEDQLEIEIFGYHYCFEINDPMTFFTKVFKTKDYDNIREFTSGFEKWLFIKETNGTTWE